MSRLYPQISTEKYGAPADTAKDEVEAAIAAAQSNFSTLFSVYGPDPDTLPVDKSTKRQRTASKGAAIVTGANVIPDEVPYVPRPPPVALNETILLLGGYENGRETSKIYVLIKETTVWKTLSVAMPYVSAYHAALIVKGELYVFGGASAHLHKLHKKKKWKKLAAMHMKRSGISNSSIQLNGCIWVMGGTVDLPTNSVEAYDAERNEWNLMPSMVESRAAAAATVINGKIFCCGGWNGERSLDSVEWYDPHGGFWNILSATLPCPSFGLSAVREGSHMVVLGIGSGNSQKGAYRLDTEAPKPVFQPLGTLSDSRHYFSGLQYGEETLVVGGKNSSGTVLTVEVFDGFQWKDGPPLPKGFYGHCCLALTEELVYPIS